MVVLSSIRVLPSTMSWAISSSKTCSQTPCRLHRRNRVYTLFQGPYRSGRSLQGIPIFSQYRIPLSITRLSFPGLPPCAGFSGGSSSFTLFHCSSVNSCRFIPLPYCCFFDLSILCLKTPSSSKMSNYVESVNQKIGKATSVQGTRMGTTAAIVVVSQSEISSYNVGDSRIYTCVRGKLKQISKDHTLARQKIDRKEYNAQEARQSLDWEKLTACLGIPRSNGVFAEITRLPITPINGTIRLLLCSDGISDMVPDNIIEAILRFGPPNQAEKKLMSEALNRGGRDNASFIIVDAIPESALISRLRYSVSF